MWLFGVHTPPIESRPPQFPHPSGVRRRASGTKPRTANTECCAVIEYVICRLLFVYTLSIYEGICTYTYNMPIIHVRSDARWRRVRGLVSNRKPCSSTPTAPAACKPGTEKRAVARSLCRHDGQTGCFEVASRRFLAPSYLFLYLSLSLYEVVYMYFSAAALLFHFQTIK